MGKEADPGISEIGKKMRHVRKLLIVAVILLLLATVVKLFSKGTKHAADVLQNLEQAGRAQLGFESMFNLPIEFYLFEELQRVRSAGFHPIWNGFKYVLRDTTDYKEFDPFIKWKKWHYKRNPPDYWLKELLYPSDRLFGEYGEMDKYINLYRLEVYGDHLVSKNGRFMAVDIVQGGDENFSLQQAIGRDHTVEFDLESRLRGSHGAGDMFVLNSLSRSEAILKRYGLIMRRNKSAYFPVEMKTGQAFRLPPINTSIVAEALHRVNSVAGVCGKDFFIPEGYSREKQDYEEFGLISLGLLDIYGIHIYWNEASQRYELQK